MRTCTFPIEITRQKAQSLRIKMWNVELINVKGATVIYGLEQRIAQTSVKIGKAKLFSLYRKEYQSSSKLSPDYQVGLALKLLNTFHVSRFPVIGQFCLSSIQHGGCQCWWVSLCYKVCLERFHIVKFRETQWFVKRKRCFSLTAKGLRKIRIFSPSRSSSVILDL